MFTSCLSCCSAHPTVNWGGQVCTTVTHIRAFSCNRNQPKSILRLSDSNVWLINPGSWSRIGEAVIIVVLLSPPEVVGPPGDLDLKTFLGRRTRGGARRACVRRCSAGILRARLSFMRCAALRRERLVGSRPPAPLIPLLLPLDTPLPLHAPLVKDHFIIVTCLRWNTYCVMCKVQCCCFPLTRADGLLWATTALMLDASACWLSTGC